MNVYLPVSINPTRYDDYLVKTCYGIYQFAHFNQLGWTIIGEDKSQQVVAWMEIPKTDII